MRLNPDTVLLGIPTAWQASSVHSHPAVSDGCRAKPTGHLYLEDEGPPSSSLFWGWPMSNEYPCCLLTVHVSFQNMQLDSSSLVQCVIEAGLWFSVTSSQRWTWQGSRKSHSVGAVYYCYSIIFIQEDRISLQSSSREVQRLHLPTEPHPEPVYYLIKVKPSISSLLVLFPLSDSIQIQWLCVSFHKVFISCEGIPHLHCTSFNGHSRIKVFSSH